MHSIENTFVIHATGKCSVCTFQPQKFHRLWPVKGLSRNVEDCPPPHFLPESTPCVTSQLVCHAHQPVSHLWWCCFRSVVNWCVGLSFRVNLLHCSFMLWKSCWRKRSCKLSFDKWFVSSKCVVTVSWSFGTLYCLTVFVSWIWEGLFSLIWCYKELKYKQIFAEKCTTHA